MDFISILIHLLNNLHILLSIIILVIMCIKFPKKIKEIDPEWLRNNIGDLIGKSFAIGGFVTLCIGLSIFVFEERWPSEYIDPTSIATSLFMVVIYLLVIIHHQWKTWARDIERKYGIPKPSHEKKQNKKD